MKIFNGCGELTITYRNFILKTYLVVWSHVRALTFVKKADIPLLNRFFKYFIVEVHRQSFHNGDLRYFSIIEVPVEKGRGIQRWLLPIVYPIINTGFSCEMLFPLNVIDILCSKFAKYWIFKTKRTHINRSIFTKLEGLPNELSDELILPS